MGDIKPDDFWSLNVMWKIKSRTQCKKKKKERKKSVFCYNVKYFLFVGKHMFVYVVL